MSLPARFRAFAASLACLAAALLPAGTAGAQTLSPCPDDLPAATRCYVGQDGNGAYYWIARPEPWNGALIVHAHGGPRLGPARPEGTAKDLTRFSVMVKEGYAWVGSSYRRGGYGVRMAAEDSENARRIAVALLGQPRRTIIHGQSWGGNVAAKYAEIYPAALPDGTRRYDGVLLTSGVLAGGTRGYDYRTDLRAVYEYYCRNHPRPDEPPYVLGEGLPAGAAMTRKELAARVDACTGVEKPASERSPQQAANLENILSVVRVPEKTLVAHMAWATFLFSDVVHVLLQGRVPFGNAHVRYEGSDDDDALNRGVPRFDADPAAVAALAADSDLTGAVTVPIVTLHAIDDPTAFVEHEAHYHAVLERAGTAALLEQNFVAESVHSKLHAPEYPAVLDALMRWIETGRKPTPPEIAAACPAYQKRYGESCAFRPDFHPRPYDTRVYPREPGKG
jgi:pimeloyl-ACP methyl ester carboxylesterase